MSRSRKLIFTLLAWLAVLILGELVLSAYWYLTKPPNRFRFDSELGHVYKEHLDFVDRRGNRFRTDALATPSIQEHAPGDRVDVLFSGDSFGAGRGSSWPNGAFEVATRALQREGEDSVSAVNISVSGFGTDQSWLRYRRFADMKPRLVVYLLFQNDLIDNVATYHNMRSKPRFELRDGQLELVDTPSKLDYLTDAFRLGKGVAAIRNRFGADLRQTTEAATRAELAAALIERWAEEVEATGATLVVVPHWHVSQSEPPEDLAATIAWLEEAGTPTTS